jgi:hypothetical protein
MWIAVLVALLLGIEIGAALSGGVEDALESLEKKIEVGFLRIGSAIHEAFPKGEIGAATATLGTLKTDEEWAEEITAKVLARIKDSVATAASKV